MTGMFDDLIPQTPAKQGASGMFDDLVPARPTDPAAMPDERYGHDWVSARDKGLANKAHDNESELDRQQRVDRDRMRHLDYTDSRNWLTKIVAPANRGGYVELGMKPLAAAADMVEGPINAIGQSVQAVFALDQSKDFVDRLNDLHDIWVKNPAETPVAEGLKKASNKLENYISAGVKETPRVTFTDPATGKSRLNSDAFKDPWTYWNIVAENAPQLGLQYAAGVRAFNAARSAGATIPQASLAAARVGRWLEGAQIFTDEYDNAREKGLTQGDAAITALGITLPSIAISQGIPGTKFDGGIEGLFFKKMAESAEKTKGLKGHLLRGLFGAGKEAGEEMAQESASILGQLTYDPHAADNAKERILMSGLGGGLLGGGEGVLVGAALAEPDAHIGAQLAQEQANREATRVANAVSRTINDPNSAGMVRSAMAAAGFGGKIGDAVHLLNETHGILTGRQDAGVGLTPEQIAQGTLLYSHLANTVANNVPLQPNWQVRQPAAPSNQPLAGVMAGGTNGAQTWGQGIAGAHFDALDSTITGMEQQLAREKAVAAIDKNPSNPANKSRIDQLETLLAQARGKRQTLTIADANSRVSPAQPPLMTTPVTPNPNTQVSVLDRIAKLRGEAHAHAVEMAQQEEAAAPQTPVATTPAAVSVPESPILAQAPKDAMAATAEPVMSAPTAPVKERNRKNKKLAAPASPVAAPVATDSTEPLAVQQPSVPMAPAVDEVPAAVPQKQTLKDRKRAKKAQAAPVPAAQTATVKSDGREIALPAETIEKINTEAEAEHAAASASGKPTKERAAEHKKVGERRKAKILEAEKNQALDQDENDSQRLSPSLKQEQASASAKVSEQPEGKGEAKVAPSEAQAEAPIAEEKGGRFAATKKAWENLKAELADPRAKAVRERGALNPNDDYESKLSMRIYQLVQSAIHDGTNTFKDFVDKLKMLTNNEWHDFLKMAGGNKGLRQIWDEVYSKGKNALETRLVYVREKISKDYMPSNPVDGSRLSDPAYRTKVARQFVQAALPFLEHHRAECERRGIPTGREWYTKRMKMFRTALIENGFPELADELHWKAFWVFNAIASNGNTPYNNAVVSIPEWAKFRNGGYQQAVNRNGFGFASMMRAEAQESAYRGVNKLLNEGGLERLVDFFENKQSGTEIRKYFPSAKHIPLDAKIEGSYGLGPKIGAFFQNGIGHTSHLTKDLWFTRTWNRLLGLKPVFEMGEDGKIDKTADAPGGPSERAAMDEAIDLLCEKTGLSPAEVQAELWYAEQNLWSRPEYMQENMNSGDFYDAAVRILPDRDRGEAPGLDIINPNDRPHVGLESIPSGASGILRGGLDASFAQQRAYHVAAMGATDLQAGLEAAGLDKLVEVKTHFGVGAFAEKVDGKLRVESNPLTTIEFRLKPGVGYTSDLKTKLDDFCSAMSILHRQAGVAWSMPDYVGNLGETNAVRFEINRTLSEKETKDIVAALAKHYSPDDVWIKANPDGFSVVAGDWTGVKGTDFHDVAKKVVDKHLPGDNYKAGYYVSRGGYAANSFGKGSPYADNLRRINSSRRSDFLRRYLLQADGRVQAVRERWSQPEGKRPGWGDPGRALRQSDFDRPGTAFDAISRRRSRGVFEGTSIPVFQRADERGEHAKGVFGVHYSNTPSLDYLDTGRYGTGSRGQEWLRVKDDDTLRNRAYFYLADDATSLPTKEQKVTGKNPYRVRLENVYDLAEDPLGLVAQANGDGTALEHAVLDAGYDAYLAPSGISGMPQGSRPIVVLGEAEIPVANVAYHDRTTGELADMVQRGEMTEAEFREEFIRRGGSYLQGGLFGNEAMWQDTKQLLTKVFTRAGEILHLDGKGKDGTAEEIMAGLMADRFAKKQQMLRLRTNLPCRDAADVALAFYGANTFLGANTDAQGLPVVQPTLVNSDTGEIHDDMNWLQKAYLKVGSPSAVLERGMLGRLLDAGYGPSSDWVKEQSRGFAIQQTFGNYFKDLYRDIANNRKALKKLFAPLGEERAKLEIQYFNVTSGLQKAQDSLWQGGLLPSERAFMEQRVKDSEAKVAVLDKQLKAMGNTPEKEKADPVRDQLREARTDLELAQDELHRANIAEAKGRTLSREDKARYRNDIEARKAELADLDKQMAGLQGRREALVQQAFRLYQDARVYMAAEYGANINAMPEWMRSHFETEQGKAELAVAEKTTVMMNRMRHELEKAGIGVLDADSAYMHRPFGRLLSNGTLKSLQKQGYWEHQGKTLSARNVDSVLDPEQVKFVSREKGSKVWFPSLYDSVEAYVGIFSRKLTGRTFANKWLYWADSNGYKFPGLAEGVRDMVKQVVAPDPSQQLKFLNDFTKFFYWKHIALSTWTAAKHAAKLAYDPIQIGPVASARGTAHLMHAKVGQFLNWAEGINPRINFGDSVIAKRARIKALVLQGHVGAKSIDQMVELGSGMSPVRLTSNAVSTIAKFSAHWPVSTVEAYDRGVTLFSSIYGYAGKKAAPDVIRNVISNTLAINFMPFDRGTATQSSIMKAVLAFQQAPIHLTEYGIQNLTDFGRTVNDIAHGRKIQDVEAGWRSVRYFVALGLISQVIDKALDASLTDWFLHEPALIKWLMNVFTKGGAKEEDGPFQPIFASAMETAGYFDKNGVGPESLLQATLPDQVFRWFENTETRKDRKAFGPEGSMERGIRTLTGAKRASEVEGAEKLEDRERGTKQTHNLRKFRKRYPRIAKLADRIVGE